MVLGDVAMSDDSCAAMAHELKIVVASVEYRLAPEHPFPAPLEDCYAGLAWLSACADERGVDRARIAIGGPSAGGGLAAGLALLARDRGEVPVRFQLLVYPMIDDRNATPSSRAITDPKVWNRHANEVGWNAYLAGRAGADDVSPYAAPARATDLAGLPPTYINVGDLDLFLDEDLAYARALMAAGVPVELHVYPGAFHGSNAFVSRSALSQRWTADERAALHRALNGEDAPRRRSEIGRSAG
jgi:acetyl esterase/lipase